MNEFTFMSSRQAIIKRQERFGDGQVAHVVTQTACETTPDGAEWVFRCPLIWEDLQKASRGVRHCNGTFSLLLPMCCRVFDTVCVSVCSV